MHNGGFIVWVAKCVDETPRVQTTKHAHLHMDMTSRPRIICIFLFLHIIHLSTLTQCRIHTYTQVHDANKIHFHSFIERVYMNHEKKEVYLIYWVINYKDIYIYVCVCVNSNIMLENRYRIGREKDIEREREAILFF